MKIVPKRISKSSSLSQKKGYDAEDAVCEEIGRKGFAILDRNYRKRFGEIDIVALDGDTLCFVEVRSASKVSAFLRFSIGSHKQRRLRNAIHSYLCSRARFSRLSVRFDVAWVVGPPYHVEYWKNVDLAVHF